jgi:regulator of sigma E protease
MYLVWVSLSLGLLNLLPIPVLDGGHLMCYLYEWIVRRPMSPQWWGFWQRVGIFMVLLLMAIAIGNDLARWWSTS